MGRGPGYTQPGGWVATCVRILERDRGVCHVCRRPGATRVDHKVPVSQGGGHEDANLAAIHPEPCHADKTERERRAALARRSRARRPRRHPDLI